MPDRLIKPIPTLQEPFQPVVSKHDLDWGASGELLDATAGRFQLLGDQLHRGAWFLCPRYTVHSPTPSEAFFRAARDARGKWLKEARQSISLRREARSVAALARRAALADIHPAGAEGHPASPPLASLTPEQRLDVLKAGHVARQLAFSGIMIIGGDHVLPRTWNRMAEEILTTNPRTNP